LTFVIFAAAEKKRSISVGTGVGGKYSEKPRRKHWDQRGHQSATAFLRPETNQGTLLVWVKVPSLVSSQTQALILRRFYVDLPSSASNKFLSTIAALFGFIYYSIKVKART
jgi:hypothetical protein